MSMLSYQADELRKMADELRHIHVDDSSVGLLFAAMGAMREAAETIDVIATALEDVLRNTGDTVWVGEAETLVDLMVALGIYGHEVYEGARPWEVER